MKTRNSSRKLPRAATGRHADSLLRVGQGAAGLRLERTLSKLPSLKGAPIRLVFGGSLWAHRGRLRAGPPGQPVHAAGFIRARRIVMDGELLGNPRELYRILVHELFHFVWVRLGNPVRRSWQALIEKEWARGARGELGYSSLWRKQQLRAEGTAARPRLWREYLCESFCDTAAWRLSGRRDHEEYTLSRCWRQRRHRWFQELLARGALPI